MSSPEAPEPAPNAVAAIRRMLWAAVPLALALVVAFFLLRGLALKPREIPSALIDKPVPSFVLPAIAGRPPGLSSADLRGQVTVVNIFASWCVPCRAEHPMLMALQRSGRAPVHGINYKDNEEGALNWLKRLGDPYVGVGADKDGRVAIDWGVYGIPETFVVNAEGRIVCKHIGPLNRYKGEDGKMTDDMAQKILPAVAAAKRGEPVRC